MGHSRPYEIQEAVQDFVIRVVRRSAPGLGLGRERCDQAPCSITEVGGVKDLGVYPPMFIQRGCLLQVF
jgi:hypothetical protein